MCFLKLEILKIGNSICISKQKKVVLTHFSITVTCTLNIYELSVYILKDINKTKNINQE